MPIVQTWIRNEDWDKYYQLHTTKQWTEFIHNALNAVGLVDEVFPTKGQMITSSEFVPANKPIKTPRNSEDGHSGLPQTQNPIIKSPKFKEADPKITKLVSDNIDSLFESKPIIHSPKDAEKAIQGSNQQLANEAVGTAVQKANAEVRKLCKIHGTPLDDRGKCLVKGCKFE